MTENLYAAYPAAYDALYANKDYDGEVEWVRNRLETDGNGGDRVLVVGCGTGEHSRRLHDLGYEVTGVDRHEAMVERARGKSAATFRVDSLPDLSVGGRYDLVWAPFTVVNHLDDAEFAPAVRAMVERLAPGGTVVVDHLASADEEPPPRLRTYPDPDGEGAYARLVQTRPVDESGRHLRWDSVVVTPDGEVFVDAHDLTDFGERYVTGVFEGCGLPVEVCDWYGEDRRDGTVYVGVDDRSR